MCEIEDVFTSVAAITGLAIAKLQSSGCIECEKRITNQRLRNCVLSRRRHHHPRSEQRKQFHPKKTQSKNTKLYCRADWGRIARRRTLWRNNDTLNILIRAEHRRWRQPVSPTLFRAPCIPFFWLSLSIFSLSLCLWMTSRFSLLTSNPSANLRVSAGERDFW